MNQQSREALIDLLFLSLYLDNHLSLAEDEVLTTALESLGWESAEPREKHIWKAFSKARDAAADAIKTESFLNERTVPIKSHGDEGPALTWLSRVLGSDGLSSTEQHFLKQIESRLYQNG